MVSKGFYDIRTWNSRFLPERSPVDGPVHYSAWHSTLSSNRCIMLRRSLNLQYLQTLTGASCHTNLTGSPNAQTWDVRKCFSCLSWSSACRMQQKCGQCVWWHGSKYIPLGFNHTAHKCDLVFISKEWLFAMSFCNWCKLSIYMIDWMILKHLNFNLLKLLWLGFLKSSFPWLTFKKVLYI